MKLIGKYMNGNYQVSIYEDGTKLRFCDDAELIPAFAENIDVKITNKCDFGCPFCHEGSTVNGLHGDIMHAEWVNTLHPYQELAIGGGNALEHPDLIPFLEKMKSMRVVSNITLRDKHFLKNMDLVDGLVAKGLVHGVGVSVSHPTEEELRIYAERPYVILHVICGIFDDEDLRAVKAVPGQNILILGYKTLRRGEFFLRSEEAEIERRQKFLRDNLDDMLAGGYFKAICFDNLAIEQTGLREHLTYGEWATQYMGDEGTSTFYIDCVSGTFAKSSTSPAAERIPLMASVDDMFNAIRQK